jgi:hypothetical protein
LRTLEPESSASTNSASHANCSFFNQLYIIDHFVAICQAIDLKGSNSKFKTS